MQIYKLSDVINVFLPTNPNKNTRATYGYSLGKMLDYVGNRPIKDITPFDLMGYISNLTKKDGSPLSPHSVNKEIKTCRVFFNWCVKANLITTSPMSAVAYHPTPRRIDRSKSMPDDDLTKILTTLREMRMWREYALIMFLADTGCRAGGVAGLKIKDINFTTKTAHVTEKGDKQRVVAFGDETATALSRWLRLRVSFTDLVFQKGKRSFTSEAVGMMVRRCCLLAGVTPRQSHSLRHRKGHQLADAGIAPTVAATALGHDSILTTLNSYYPKDDERALRALRGLSIGEDTIPKKDNITPFPSTKKAN
jgi:site-specific recombinase XerD